MKPTISLLHVSGLLPHNHRFPLFLAGIPIHFRGRKRNASNRPRKRNRRAGQAFNR